MTGPADRTTGDTDTPAWLVELLGEHTFNHKGVCECGRISGKNPEYIRAHVAAVVWAELKARAVRVPFDLDQLNALGDTDD